MASDRRFSKIYRRMWNDERFRSLSAPPPNAQTLFTRLLCGPELTNIPGLFSVGEAALAEALGWPLEGFREAFAELSAKGLAKADWKARLVLVPNAIRYNPPESPNVILSWRQAWDELPECHLKREAYAALRVFAEGLPEGFRKAFAKLCRHPSANQEQEQEQEQEIPPAPPVGAPRVPAEEIVPSPAPQPNADGAFGFTLDAWADGVREVTGRPCTAPRGAAARAALDALGAHAPASLDARGRCDWARSAAREYATAHAGRELNSFRFADWLNSGRPAPTAPKSGAYRRGRPMQPMPAGVPWARSFDEIAAEQMAEFEAHQAGKVGGS